MNDPGLDKPMEDAAKDVEKDPKDKKDNGELEEDEEFNFLDPSRWWFASTACPLLAGTFGPMASAFNLCALVEPWRLYIPPGSSQGFGQKIQDPKWLVAVNGVSFALAIIANVALSLNMARVVSFSIAQPITIVGWFISSFLLIALVAVAPTHHFQLQPPQSHALSQAFYYAIISAVLYVIVAALMIITVFGAMRGHYEKQFRLTVSQRTLMMQTVSFLIYLLLGALVFSKVENWEFLDALYWADFTLLTVGIGDSFTPETHLGRGLLFPFAIGGIVMIGLVIGAIRGLVLERGKEKLRARLTEKKRESALSNVNMEKQTVKIGQFNKFHFKLEGLTEVQRREQEFHIMRRIQRSSESRRRWMALAVSMTAACMLWFLGAVVFQQSEVDQGWSYFVALYFSYTSLLTIGYGDFEPQSNSGKPFFVVWSLLAVPTLTVLISNMGDTVVKAFMEAVNWLGAITLFPSKENRPKESLRQFLTHAKRVSTVTPKDLNITAEKPPGGAASRGGHNEANPPKGHPVTDLLAAAFEEDELDEALNAEQHGDPALRDLHFYHYVLAREMRNVFRDTQANPPKEYTYHQWRYYLKLIGHNEDNPDEHRRPSINQDAKPNPDELKTEGGDTNKTNKQPWSWLGWRSPLMGHKSEAEWILEKLGLQLEQELKRMGQPDSLSKPPLTMKDLLREEEEAAASDDERDESPSTLNTEARRELRQKED